jgi:hypothetical protein
VEGTAGKGAYAGKPYAAGDPVVAYVGTVSRKKASRTSKYIYALVTGEEKPLNVNSAQGLWKARYVNGGAEEPNVQFSEASVLGVLTPVLFAIRPIIRGEEFIVDYGSDFHYGVGERIHKRYLHLEERVHAFEESDGDGEIGSRMAGAELVAVVPSSASSSKCGNDDASGDAMLAATLAMLDGNATPDSINISTTRKRGHAQVAQEYSPRVKKTPRVNWFSFVLSILLYVSSVY